MCYSKNPKSVKAAGFYKMFLNFNFGNNDKLKKKKKNRIFTHL